MGQEQELARRHCVSCAPGTPPIGEDRAVELEAQLDPSWARDGTVVLRRELRFGNFRDAFGFVARLALLAESEGHHPDIELGWGRVAVTLTTHAAGGLTDNDFILAARLDRL
jgi:4a-hydroxytetrahydrobiopterin dehydratase